MDDVQQQYLLPESGERDLGLMNLIPHETIYKTQIVIEFFISFQFKLLLGGQFRILLLDKQ